MKRRRSAQVSTLQALAPALEFPVTICVLCYGDHSPLARRFLESLYLHTDPALFFLRAGLNEVAPSTRSLFEEFKSRFSNIQIFSEPKNIFKNPLMRRMFNEPAIDSKWTIWCDDDTHFTRPDWLQRLALKIETFPDVAQWGWIHFTWTREQPVLEWIRRASWYGGVPFSHGIDEHGSSAVRFRFATGAFWAIRTEVLRQLDWPDPRLLLASEDFMLGEALRQNDLLVRDFHYGVKVNDGSSRNPNAGVPIGL